jgi:hypothetical protein
MPQVFYPLAATLKQASQRRTSYADGEVRLWTDALPVVGPQTPQADYEAAAPTYGGYAPIGVDEWFVPGLAPGSGYMINSPLVQFDSTPGDPLITNSIQGIYYVDGEGDIALVIVLDQPVQMGAAGQIMAFYLSDFFPAQ